MYLSADSLLYAHKMPNNVKSNCNGLIIIFQRSELNVHVLKASILSSHLITYRTLSILTKIYWNHSCMLVTNHAIFFSLGMRIIQITYSPSPTHFIHIVLTIQYTS